MNSALAGRRKSYSERALVTRTTSRRFRAGTRKNKRLRNVGTFSSDKEKSA